MKDSIQNQVRTLRIPSHAIWTYECTSNISTIYQQYDGTLFAWLYYCLLGQYFNILQQHGRICTTCETGIIKTTNCKTTSQTEEMWIPCARNRLLGIQNYTRRNTNRQRKSTGSTRLAYTKKHQRTTVIHRTYQLLSTIYQGICKNHDTYVYAIEKRSTI